MSCFGSTRTNFSNSEMSLASSALMTALSTSDADYETSDEQLLSPQALDEAEISQGSSNLRWSSNLLSSQSVSCLVDTSEDFVTSSDADKYAMTVKSDTCLNQQSKIISDFINNMHLQEQQQEQQGEDRDSPALSIKTSATSVQTEFFPATNVSDSPYGSIVDMNIEDSVGAIHEKKIADAGPGGIEYSDEHPMRSKGRETIRSTLSETRHKILENLAQATSDKLFSKAAGFCHLDPGSSTTKAAVERSQGEAPVHRATSRRPFQRCRGVESLLQIDYELQPLNLMLSRLLAEFRAMDLRGKLGFVDPAAAAPQCDRSAMLPESIRASTFKDVQSRLQREEGDTCMKFLCSLSHEYLSDNPAASSEEANIAATPQISRSCEDNCLLLRDSLAKGSSRRTKSAGKHSECSNETERNPRCHLEARCYSTADDPHRLQKATSEEDQFGSGVFRLTEIASTN